MEATGRQPCVRQHAPDGAPVHDDRQRPEQATQYRLVQPHAATCFAPAEDTPGADLPQFVKAEPGHKQSSGLFVPGEGSGQWHDAPSKGPDAAQPRPFSRPGDQGRWDYLVPMAGEMPEIVARGRT